MQINYFVFFSIAGLANLLLLIIIYFSKERLQSRENNIYKLLMLCTCIGIVNEIVMVYFVPFLEQNYIVKEVISKSFLVICELWILLLASYTMTVSKKISNLDTKNINKSQIILGLVFVICAVFTSLLPIEYAYNDSHTSWLYTYGLSTKMVFISGLVFIFISIFYVLKNKERYKDKRFIPIYTYIALSIVVSILQQINPTMLLISYTETVIMNLMYFTIENPDLNLLRQVEIAREHAEKANRAKTDFLSSMSHEIRTPLNAIVGFSEMIQTEDDMNEIKNEAKDIVMASHTLLEIVNGILDISKIEANKMEIVNKDYELLPELENISKLMLPRIGEKPLELRCKFAEDIPHVLYGDIAKIKEVITNILTNAVKYTEEGHIDFEVNCINQKEQSSLVIKVADTGRGIKKDQIDKLFTKFQRLDEDKNTTIEGTGLGLAITKSLVEMMGGKIIVNSEYGKGSTFTIYLKQKIVKLHKESDKKEYDDRDDYDFTGYTILVVDDNQLNLKVATKLLNRYNITVETASDGFECIDKIKAGNKYDLVLLDDMMPRMKGTETLTRLKQDPNYSIPTIALTANAITGMKEQYMSMGFNDYLGKPIEKMELLRVLSKFLKPKVNNNNVKEEKIEVKEEPIEKIEIDEKPTNSKKILVVDDNQINIKIASKMLEKYNYDIDTASSGQESIDKVKNTKYDLIFMDHMMPGMDGIQTLNELKKIDGFNTPVIALTADAIVGSKEKFLEAGFDDYISKPIDRNYLDELIKKILG